MTRDQEIVQKLQQRLQGWNPDEPCSSHYSAPYERALLAAHKRKYGHLYQGAKEQLLTKLEAIRERDSEEEKTI